MNEIFVRIAVRILAFLVLLGAVERVTAMDHGGVSSGSCGSGQHGYDAPVPPSRSGGPLQEEPWRTVRLQQCDAIIDNFNGGISDASCYGGPSVQQGTPTFDDSGDAVRSSEMVGESSRGSSATLVWPSEEQLAKIYEDIAAKNIYTGPDTAVGGRGRGYYTCKKCGLLADSRDKITAHACWHLNVSPFKCSGCGYKTTSKASLVAHMAIHLPARFRCDKCPYAARQSRHLATHKRRCHLATGGAFKCQQCPCRFVTKNSLSAHVVAVHEHCEGDATRYAQKRGNRGPRARSLQPSAKVYGAAVDAGSSEITSNLPASDSYSASSVGAVAAPDTTLQQGGSTAINGFPWAWANDGDAVVAGAVQSQAECPDSGTADTKSPPSDIGW